VAKASGIAVIHAPSAAPRANATCERFVRSLRRECLDQVLVMSERQLIRIMKDYGLHFHPARSHQGIAQRSAAPRVAPPGEPKTIRVNAFPVLNGLHHDYRQAVA
jgi:putative transposase